MVRLKDDCDGNLIAEKNEFQFHYGSVKRIGRLRNPKFVIEFQFHYGSVKRDNLKQLIAGGSQFQFHYGSVKSIKGS